MVCPLREQALRRGNAVGLVAPGITRDYSEVDVHCSRLTGRLRDTIGIGAGDRIAVVSANGPEWFPLLFACLRTGAVMCPLNIRQPLRALLEQLSDLRPALVLSDRDLHGLRFPVREMETFVRGAAGFPDEEAFVDPARTATCLYTSGSGGRAKRIEHQLAHHLASANSANQAAPLAPGDRWLCSLPLFHAGGIAILFRSVLAGAAAGFAGKDSEWTDEIERLGITHLSLVPTQLRRWMQCGSFAHSAKGVKRVLMGGAPMPDELLKQAVEAGLPLAVSYGLTETASQIAATPPGEPPAGAGKILPHARIHISESGEIQVRAGSVPEALLTDGWLRTGDRGRMEGDVLFVEGRMDRQFISGGENIQPERIERELQACIGTTCVVVPVADPEFGLRPAAWVEAEVTEEQVNRWNQALRRRIPGYMIPVRYKTLPPQTGLKPRLDDLRREMAT